jgi:hypothetical protein
MRFRSSGVNFAARVFPPSAKPPECDGSRVLLWRGLRFFIQLLDDIELTVFKPRLGLCLSALA